MDFFVFIAPNYIYYTLSTIPQVLAGIVALLGALWIYRIENLNTKLKSTAVTIMREVGVLLDDDEIKMRTNYDYDSEKNTVRRTLLNGLMNKGDSKGKKYTKEQAHKYIDRLRIRMNSSIEQDDYEWIENAIETIDFNVNNEITNKTNRRFKTLWNEKLAFTKWIRLSVVFSIITIILSTALLPFSRTIDQNIAWVYLIFCINGFFFILSVIFVAKSVLRTLNIRNIS